MKKLTTSILIICWSVIGIVAQEPIPTLVPPTPMAASQEFIPDNMPTQSRLARIQQEGFVRVGVLYNEPPFAELRVDGEVRGFDADLARLIVEDAWELELELIQVTRQNALAMLENRQVDFLLASQVHDRSLDAVVEFSHTYHVGSQSVMVRADDPAESLLNLANRRVGAVIATEGEAALNDWQASSGIPLTIQPYLTLDRAFVALVGGEVDGIVAKEHRLLRVAADYPGLIKVIEEPLRRESYAIVMPRQDVNLSNLVNRTLQYLLDNGDLETLHSEYFPGQEFLFEALPVWANLGENPPKPADFSTDQPLPEQSVLSRIQNNEPIRIAGLSELPDDASLGERRLNDVNRSLAEQMVSRWGANAEFLPNSRTNALALVAEGAADLAVGVQPDWSQANRVDFSLPYLLYGDRLMVPMRSTVQGFNELRGRWIGVMSNDDGAEQRAREWADSINASVRFYITRESDAAFTILVENNADVIYGDSLKLLAHLQENPDDVRLTERWYSRNYVALATPRNDLDFRLLVDYTLQDMYADGALQTIAAPAFPVDDEFPQFDIWTGDSSHLGVASGS